MKSTTVLQCGVPTRMFPDPNNNAEDCEAGGQDKYGLRPRRAGGRRQGSSKASSKPPARAPPLSKYRRRTANARERTRMREINSAFEALRKRVPGGEQTSSNPSAERLTKISTLRLATQYIAALAAILSAPFHDLPSESSSFTSLSPDAANSFCTDFSASPDFPDSSLSPSEFMGSSFSSDFSDHALSPFDPFLSDYS